MTSTSLMHYLQALPRITDAERLEVLNAAVDYMRKAMQQHGQLQLSFICTHNSRRSQFAQVWAWVLARQLGFANVQCFSAGTETTAVYPSVLSALQYAGLEIDQREAGSNPVFEVRVPGKEESLTLFSKTVDHASNPKLGLLALMTCDQAYEACPIVPGAAHRIPLMYQDPKVADGTAFEGAKYAERSQQIASEMKYIFEQLNA